MTKRSSPAARKFGRSVRALRQQQKLTQEQLGKKLGLERSWVCRIENGEATIADGATEALRIARALGVPLGSLLPQTRTSAQP